MHLIARNVVYTVVISHKQNLPPGIPPRVCSDQRKLSFSVESLLCSFLMNPIKHLWTAIVLTRLVCLLPAPHNELQEVGLYQKLLYMGTYQVPNKKRYYKSTLPMVTTWAIFRI